MDGNAAPLDLKSGLVACVDELKTLLPRSNAPTKLYQTPT